MNKTVANRYLTEEIYKIIRSGFFAVYKRPNFTSAEELEDLKDGIVKGLEADMAIEEKRYLLRAGHGGNLDSMASGVLAVGLCDGCKILPQMLASSKRYTVTGQLGTATDTYNSTGQVVEKARFDHVTQPKLEEALQEFIGEIFQKPPAYSALKIKGKRASDIVRLGGEVELLPRPVVCHTAHCVSFDPPHFVVDVSCGQGFYVRSLIHDLAQAVGSCGHVTALVRTKHGPFSLKDCLHAENYTLDHVSRAIKAAHEKHPKLVSQLEDNLEAYTAKQKIRTEKTEQRFTNKKLKQKNVKKEKLEAKVFVDYFSLKSACESKSSS